MKCMQSGLELSVLHTQNELLDQPENKQYNNNNNN